MPELPEVETVRRGLKKLLPGREVQSVKTDWPKSLQGSKADVQQFLLGARIEAVHRRAKMLLIELSSDYTLVVHLKMTGQLVFQSDKERFGAGHPTDSLAHKLPDSSTRVEIAFTDGSRLFFNDQRKFGWIRLLPTPELEHLPLFQKLGPEPLDPSFSWQQLRAMLQRRPNASIKAALLDQTVISGIGNIYADEALWGAKIHPTMPIRSLSLVQIKRLHGELISILQLAISKGGSTDKNYVDAKGKKGSYLHFARVFRREGQSCPRCGNAIIKLRVSGRGTHVCPVCQKLKSPRAAKTEANQ